MRITVHTIIKNEDRWIWYALQSVLPYVEKIFVYDTGSTDKTLEIVKSIKSSKIIVQERGEVDKEGLTKLRMEQLEKTETEWFLILDGDEIWPKMEISKSLDLVKNSPKNTVALIHKVRNSIGDIFHYLSEETGHYQIAGYQGNLNIRFIKKTSSMKVTGTYPLEFYEDDNGPIQNQENNLIYANSWYLHTSFLNRSSKVKNKVSGSFGKNKLWQKGLKMDFNELPEVFNLEVPKIVDKPFKKRGLKYDILANVLNPVFLLKRKIK